MSRHARILRLVRLAAFGAVVVPALRAQPEPVVLALCDSPFKRPAVVAPTPPAADPLLRLEFCGLHTIEGKTFAAFATGAAPRSISLPLDESLPGLNVSEFHPGPPRPSVLVRDGNWERRIELRPSRILAAVGASPAPDRGLLMPRADPSPRLQEISVEIQRRREARARLAPAP